ETAWQRLERLGEQACVLIDLVAGGDFALRGIDDELGRRHRGNGIQKLRIKDGQQGRSDLRKFVFDVALDSCREEGKRLDKPFHLRIRGWPDANLQARRDLGIARGERAAGCAPVGQLRAAVFDKILPAV